MVLAGVGWWLLLAGCLAGWLLLAAWLPGCLAAWLAVQQSMDAYRLPCEVDTLLCTTLQSCVCICIFCNLWMLGRCC